MLRDRWHRDVEPSVQLADGARLARRELYNLAPATMGQRAVNAVKMIAQFERSFVLELSLFICSAPTVFFQKV